MSRTGPRTAAAFLGTVLSGGTRDPFRSLLRDTFGTLAIRIATAGLGMLTTFILARLMGPSDFGVFVYATAWLGVLVILALQGWHQLLLREIAAALAHESWGRIAGVLRHANLSVLVGSIALAALAAAAAPLVFDPDREAQALLTFRIALVGLPLACLSTLRTTALRGFQRIVAGQIPDLAVQPLFILLLLAVYFLLDRPLSPPLVAGLHVPIAALAFLGGSYLLLRTVPRPVKTAQPAYARAGWTRAALPLLAIGAIQFGNLQADVLMLGALARPEDVGIYAVARRVAETIVFAMAAVEFALAPQIAGLYAAGKLAELQGLVLRSTRLILLFSAPLAALLLLGGEWVLWLFGPQYTAGAAALGVLVMGQFLNAFCGPVGQLAIHTGHERITVAAVGASLLLNVALNAMLIPRYGPLGAAIATALSLASWNALLLAFVYRRTGILSLGFRVRSGFLAP